MIIEDQPSITIDNSSKKLVGFDINKEYLINNEDYKIVSDSIDIEKTWYFKNIEIITKAKSHKYINSEPLNLFINPLDFDNYFDESLLTNVLPNGSVDSELEDKINLFSSSYSNHSSHTLSNDEQNVLKNNLNVELPYYHDDVFDNYLNLEKFVSSISILDYQILQDGDKDYVLISGVKDNYKNTVSEIFIPKEIESITDIRIDDESFKLIENVQYEKLNTIIFEQKPHYLGDNVFSGLSLNILDFGYVDDLSYSIDFNFQSRTIQEGEYTYTSLCSQAFKGLKHVDKLRLPLKICEDDTAKFYSVLFDTNGKKLIEYSDDEFGGFNALILPRPKEGTYKYYAKKIANMKISSLYIPKNIEFYPEFNKDLYLRLVQFEKGYSFLKNEKEYLGNAYYYFIECYALQYYIRDIFGTYDIPKKFMRGNLSFKGQINYENVQSIGSEAFRGAKLPKNISLKNVTSIAEKAFYMPFKLEQIDIYKSDTISSSSPLEIGKNCFINQENSSFKIKKIVFHNFEENEIKKDSSYKSEDIIEEFVND